MAITTEELQQNLSKYIIMAENEQILITANGKVVAMLSNPNQDRIETAKSLFGILPDDITLEDANKERLSAL
ncbi:MAG: type II toxin-antitoxin system prevent-host-death family antitoxin [Spirochaetaceae bacterium]|nr:type II toxin-antitoxin system prevent-host-death family antitoxin [Spirochaetaceae bacterium]MBR4824411.1 type II toxin-antitoxin system prevent-host-death family antitoxin [Spirochaetaceae bacterium]